MKNQQLKQELANDNKVKYNISVEDKTCAKYRNWPFSKHLSWGNDKSGQVQGTTIKASEGNVKENKNGLSKNKGEV